MADKMIVQMELKHIEDVLIIEELCFPIPWSEEAFKQEVLHNQLSRYIVIIENEKVIAYGGMWLIIDEAHITNIAVHPQYKGQGKGRQIVSGLIEVAKKEGVNKLTLEVRKGNLAAISLYKSFGFEVAGVRKGFYYDNGEDALIMWRN